MPKSGIARSYGEFAFSFLRTLHTHFQSASTSFPSHGRRASTSLPHILSSICHWLFPWSRLDSDWSKMKSQSSFYLHVPSCYVCWTLLRYSVASCIYSLRSLWSDPWPVFSWVICSPGSLCFGCYGAWALYQMHCWQGFSPTLWASTTLGCFLCSV